jgi:hypothetical protein
MLKPIGLTSTYQQIEIQAENEWMKNVQNDYANDT